MDLTGIASLFEAARAKAISCESFRFKGGERTYQGPPVNPVGILAWETVAPDSPRLGEVRHLLVLAEHVAPQYWPWKDDSSFPPGTEGVLLAQLDNDLQLAGWIQDSKSLDGLTFEVCPNGIMEMLSAKFEGTRNFRVRILFSTRSMEPRT